MLSGVETYDDCGGLGNPKQCTVYLLAEVQWRKKRSEDQSELGKFYHAVVCMYQGGQSLLFTWVGNLACSTTDATDWMAYLYPPQHTIQCFISCFLHAKPYILLVFPDGSSNSQFDQVKNPGDSVQLQFRSWLGKKHERDTERERRRETEKDGGGITKEL